MSSLFNKEYYWTVSMDENRSEDGKLLRELFAERTGEKDISKLVGPCSVLEMMIALARRWRIDIMSDDGSEEGFESYFWEMIRNLGLQKCTNEKFVPEKVDKKLEILLDRDYNANGKGSLFPIKTGTSNQNTTEIWYQLQAYLAEKEKN